jgi:protein arginine kinase activator
MNQMKCELCHNAEAETAIVGKVAGEEQELYVCRACAQAASRKEVVAAEEHRQRAGDQTPEADALSALPLMGMILDAAFEIVGREAALSEPTCPVCGITRSEYRKASRLGCPACYEAFAKELDQAILEMHRSLQHVGKTPEKAKSVRQRQELENALGEAVKNQRYEEAIALRDQIKRLGQSDKPQGGPT